MKQLTKLLSITAIVLTVAPDNATYAQNKFHLGISTPHYFSTGRYGSYLDMQNEVQEHSGSDALKFRPSTGFGLFGELEFNGNFSFDIYYQKYSNKTNFGKNNVDNFTPIATGKTSQYKISHSIIGVGISYKTFQIKGYDVWMFSALSGGSRKFTWRPKGGDFSNERRTTNRYFISSSDAPMYLSLGLSPRVTFANKFIFSPKIGYEMELMRNTGMYEGMSNMVHATYATNYSQTDLQAIMNEYADKNKASLNRFFIELRVGMKLGKN